ncbi:hypothetical protein MTR_6g037460 [Medicago truncatula]|uniref:Uncharacterized protein n=1 Tax=Medicago truncatula TaxID=3880 RepID=A0A072U8C7_MEDTR|nr:hypothetical protein MTR_6g037460 [Medicago truncatula]
MPREQDPADDQRLSVFLIEKALSKLSTGEEQILAIFDLRGFGPENADLKYLNFLEIMLRVEIETSISLLLHFAIFSSNRHVKFFSAETLKKEYFTDETLPSNNFQSLKFGAKVSSVKYSFLRVSAEQNLTCKGKRKWTNHVKQD